MMTQEQMSLILCKFVTLFPNFTLSEATIKTWHSLYDDEDPIMFHSALKQCISQKGRAFFPTPGEVNAILQPMKTKQLPLSGEVWAQLLKWASSSFSESKVVLLLEDNPTAQRALQQTGWDNIRLADIDKSLPFLKRDFERHYSDTQEHSDVDNLINIGREAAAEMLARIEARSKTQIGTKI